MRKIVKTETNRVCEPQQDALMAVPLPYVPQLPPPPSGGGGVPVVIGGGGIGGFGGGGFFGGFFGGSSGGGGGNVVVSSTTPARLDLGGTLHGAVRQHLIGRQCDHQGGGVSNSTGGVSTSTSSSSGRFRLQRGAARTGGFELHRRRSTSSGTSRQHSSSTSRPDRQVSTSSSTSRRLQLVSGAPFERRHAPVDVPPADAMLFGAAAATLVDGASWARPRTEHKGA